MRPATRNDSTHGELVVVGHLAEILHRFSDGSQVEPALGASGGWQHSSPHHPGAPRVSSGQGQVGGLANPLGQELQRARPGDALDRLPALRQ